MTIKMKFKIQNSKFKIRNSRRSGAALLVVLFVVMAITILSLGFLARSDVELACGENMILRTQMDYLAESALEHARGLILNPQDVDSEYWAGDVRQQLVAGSDDYYDVNVVKLGECNYQITCDAYREKNGEKTGRSSLEAELRLDPCIAYWAGGKTTIKSRVAVNGDVYCGDELTIAGTVNGDAYAKKTITGPAAGQTYSSVSSPPVSLPGLAPADFSSQYYIGSQAYSVQQIATGDYNDVSWGSAGDEPPRVYYCSGDLNLGGNVHITGMLVVECSLTIKQNSNVVITAAKNFPALLINHDLRIPDEAQLGVTGFVQIGHKMSINGHTGGASVDILGALYIISEGTDASSDYGTTNITAAPDKAAIQISDGSGNTVRWSPAAGAFFRSIKRK